MEGGSVGALCKRKVTEGGRRGLEVGDLDLVQLVADGDRFVDGSEEEGLMMLVALFLKVGIPILGNHGLAHILLLGRFSHIESKYQIIIFMLQLINSSSTHFLNPSSKFETPLPPYPPPLASLFHLPLPISLFSPLNHL